MRRFLQLHLLTPYGPSNLNRDELGQPKGATFGGAPRLRISSQSLKRAWRTSDIFAHQLSDHLAVRTRRIGAKVQVHLRERQLSDEQTVVIARVLARVFGEAHDLKDDNPTFTKQLVFVAPEEEKRALDFAVALASGEEDLSRYDVDGAKGQSAKSKAKRAVESLRKELLRATDTAADIAMFGRMLAAAPEFNREAAVQVSHAITTHRAEAEEDYYTAVDDLKPKNADDSGAGFLGEQGFGSGLFYLYVCVDRESLIHNLGGDEQAEGIWQNAIAALVEAATTVSPGGKQASFASRARAVYARAESGDGQPRSLLPAFLKPVAGTDQAAASIGVLKRYADNLDAVYGPCAESYYEVDATKPEGTFAALGKFAVA